MIDTTIYKISKILLVVIANLIAVFLYSLFLSHIPTAFGFLGWIGLSTLAGNINLVGILVLVLIAFLVFGIPLLVIVVSGKVAYKWIKESEGIKSFYRIIAVILAVLIWVGWYFGLEKITKIVG